MCYVLLYVAGSRFISTEERTYGIAKDNSWARNGMSTRTVVAQMRKKPWRRIFTDEIDEVQPRSINEKTQQLLFICLSHHEYGMVRIRGLKL